MPVSCKCSNFSSLLAKPNLGPKYYEKAGAATRLYACVLEVPYLNLVGDTGYPEGSSSFFFLKSSQSNGDKNFLMRAEMVPSQFCLPLSEWTRKFFCPLWHHPPSALSHIMSQLSLFGFLQVLLLQRTTNAMLSLLYRDSNVKIFHRSRHK